MIALESLCNDTENCFRLDIVRGEGTKRMIQHLKSLGGSPFLNASEWDSTRFDLKKIVESEAPDAVLMLLDRRVARCMHPKNESKEILCLVVDFAWTNTNFTRHDLTSMLLDINESYLIDDTRKKILKAKIKIAVNRMLDYNVLKV
jgi:hypothetical protein